MVLRTFTQDGLGVQNIPSQRSRPSMNRTHASILTWHVAALVYYFYTALVAQPTDASRLVDLSHTFDESTIYWVTAKRLNFSVTYNGTAEAEGKDYWRQADEISAGTHGGTHMDSPCHFALGRWCVSDIPIERLVIQAAVIDISKDVGDDPGVHLSTRHLTEWEETHGRIPDGSLLLVRSGWSRFWPDPLSYSGTVERNASLLRFPSVKPEAAKWLVENRDIVGLGVDTMSIDIPGGMPGTHVTLMEKNIYGLENVNLQQPLPPTGVRVHVMPMKLKGASGAPCRIFAELPGEMASGNAGLPDSLTLIRTMAFMAAFWAYFGRRFY